MDTNPTQDQLFITRLLSQLPRLRPLSNRELAQRLIKYVSFPKR